MAERVRSFAEAVLARAEAAPDGELVRLAGERGWTAAGLAERAGALARGLASLAGPGDLVATALRNGPEAVALTTALSMLGAVELPLPPELDAGWARRLAKSGGCVATVADSARLRGEPHLGGLAGSTGSTVVTDGPGGIALAELAADGGRLPSFVPSDGSPALVMTTSGTTGKPKGAVLPNGAALGQARRVQRAMRYDGSDVLYNFFPWQHINARHAAFLPAVLGGAVLVVDRGFSASRFWEVARAEGVTAFNFMGAVCVLLLRRPPDGRPHPVRRAYGGPAPAWLVHEMAERFGVRLLQAYACTELGDVATTPAGELRPGAAGRPVPEYEVRTVDGELLVRPRHPDLTFTHYLGEPEATEAAWQDGWFRTGDQVRVQDGWLYFEGRSADVIRRRGINISAAGVEEAAASMPGVTAAAAVAVPSELTEDEVLLVVVPAGDTLDPRAVREHCAARLPRHAVPRYVSVEKDLPRNGSFKLVRAPLRDRGLPPGVWDAESEGAA
ncbi:AMP-binding protein [Amycolatopsis jiangsuensis]|uniref:Crotonobetaine/carnitine-CoA ligase n=1 Tax=Amycolatopsis jiangsuensis TaxID=1181879 RepID=A0A840IS87_9PSEU|nr:AMP-binding protein [Amycolatopsis jiangsuensis]MBB4683874.1 crotonobetaine/carnitine-CoA ligase [Amycolatopsis jiangsuensis]